MKSGGADITLSISSANAEKPEVQITLSGPTGVWFGVGFDATSMANAPYAIVVDGNIHIILSCICKN